MKKVIIATIVGTLIYFAWLSLSWMALGLHNNTIKHSPAQDSIMRMLENNIKESGVYIVPTTDPQSPNARDKEMELYKERLGKPWAMVLYNTTFDGFNASQMIMGLLYNLIAVLVVTLVIYNGAFGSFGARFIVAMGFGIVTIVSTKLTEMNFWEFPWHFIAGDILDILLAWTFIGLWLGWYLGRK